MDWLVEWMASCQVLDGAPVLFQILCCISTNHFRIFLDCLAQLSNTKLICRYLTSFSYSRLSIWPAADEHGRARCLSYNANGALVCASTGVFKQEVTRTLARWAFAIVSPVLAVFVKVESNRRCNYLGKAQQMLSRAPASCGCKGYD